MIKLLLLGIWGFSGGVIISAGVFSLLAAVGMIPRYVWKFHIAKKLQFFEEMIIWGTGIGGALSVYPIFFHEISMRIPFTNELRQVLLGIVGFFSGIFVGSVAVTVAEMLGSIPIFFHRIRMHNGIKWVVWGLAFGKCIGSLLYFFWGVSVKL